jgi:hypothetical protein
VRPAVFADLGRRSAPERLEWRRVVRSVAAAVVPDGVVSMGDFKSFERRVFRVGLLCLLSASSRVAPGQDCNGNGIPDHEELDGAELLFEDHDGAILPPGVTVLMTGLWHTELACRPAGPCGASQFAYFGQATACDYDAGWVYGNYELRGVALPAQHEVTLSFCSFYEGEGGATGADYDLAFVFVRPQGSSVLELVDNVSGTAPQAEWESR